MLAVAVLLTSSALSAVPQRPETDAVELVEVNHCYNRDTGERRFVQIVYWDRQGSACLHVRQWHMADKLYAIYPPKDGATSEYTIVRQAETPGGMQVVRAKRCKVTHTFNDPEEVDRQSFPLEARRPLSK